MQKSLKFSAVEAHIRRLIRDQKAISMADFMHHVLYHPEGYYRSQKAIGAPHDFITAPEISQMFGELIGLWLGQAWQNMGEPQPFNFVEFGPGRGTLMADALRVLKLVPEFLDHMALHLCDVNPQLIKQQEKRLKNHQPHWFQSINELPKGPIVFIANEFLDCFPLHQILSDGNLIYERKVTLGDQGQLEMMLDPKITPMLGTRHEQASANICKTIEICPSANHWAYALGEHIQRYGGVGLIVDYGSLIDGTGDTIQALYQHRKVGILDHIGQADLTAHVNFAEISRSFQAAGARTYQGMTQGEFLIDIGIKIRAKGLAHEKDDETKAMIESGLNRLTDKAAMGDLFKVIAISDTRQNSLPPFNQED